MDINANKIAEVLSNAESLSANRKRLLLQKLQAASTVNSQATSSGNRLVAFVRSKPSHRIEQAQLRAHCDAALPNYMVPQVFVMLDDLPRTAAGKVDRRQLALYEIGKDSAQEGDDHGGMVAPRNEVEKTLVNIWVAVLGMDDVSVFDNFFELGGDSLQIIRILSRAAKEGLSLKPDEMFAHPTIAEQAQLVTKSETAEATNVSTGDLPLMPIQHWFFSRIQTDPHHWNQSFLFELEAKLDESQVQLIVDGIYQHHDALRTQFKKAGEAWVANVVQAGSATMHYLNMDTVPKDQIDQKILEQANQLNPSLNLSAGPLIVFAYFRLPQDMTDRLLIVAHHILIDAESWGLLSSDIEALVNCTLHQQPLKLPQKSHSFVAWSTQLERYAKSHKVDELVNGWATLCAGLSPTIPTDYQSDSNPSTVTPLVGSHLSGVKNIEQHVLSFSSSLDRQATQSLVSTASGVLNTPFYVVLVTALAQLLAKWCDRCDIAFDMEGHGREALFDDINTARTVGWFTSVFPVALRANDQSQWQNSHEALRLVKQTLQSMPLKGMGYGIAREMADDSSKRQVLHKHAKSEVLFNYLGTVSTSDNPDSLLRLMSNRCGTARSANCERAYLLEINTRIQDQQLVIDWSYNRTIHDTSTIENLASQFNTCLASFLSDTNNASPIVVPSDFPLADLDQSELDNLADLLGDMDDD